MSLDRDADIRRSSAGAPESKSTHGQRGASKSERYRTSVLNGIRTRRQLLRDLGLVAVGIAGAVLFDKSGANNATGQSINSSTDSIDKFVRRTMWDAQTTAGNALKSYGEKLKPPEKRP